jgi:hypothetical protein
MIGECAVVRHNVITCDHTLGMTMKRVGVREFRDRATRYRAGDEVLAIERHWQPIGFCIPTGASRQEDFAQALARLEQTVRQILGETGMNEEALARLFDLNEPLPDLPDAPADAHAPGR